MKKIRKVSENACKYLKSMVNSRIVNAPETRQCEKFD